MTGWQLNAAGVDASKLSNMPLLYYFFIIIVSFSLNYNPFSSTRPTHTAFWLHSLLFFQTAIKSESLNLAGGATQRWPLCDLLV